MNDIMKIVFVSLLAITVSFIILFIYLDWNNVNLVNEKLSSNFMTQDDGKKKIFIIGVSYVNQLNTTYIQQYISDNGLQNFEVIKIAEGGGRPSVRVKDLETMISVHPVSIFYGLGPSDIGFKPYPPNAQPQCTYKFDSTNQGTSELFFNRIPRFQDIYQYFGKGIDIQNPNHVTTNLLRIFVDKNTLVVNSNVEIESQINRIAQEEFSRTSGIMNSSEMNKPLDQVSYLCKEDREIELSSLQTMVSRFKQENIQVVLFIPPFTKSYIDSLGMNGKSLFLSSLEDFSKKNDLKMYSLFENYTKLEIFRDPYHVALSPKVVIYNKDVGIMITNEMKSLTRLHSVDISEQDLSYRDLSYADLRFADLSNKNMTGANLQGANLYGANLNGTILKGVNLMGAYLHKLDLSNKDLLDTVLTGADLSETNLQGVSLAGKDLTGTILNGVNLSGKDLRGTILTESSLINTNLDGVNLSGKDLRGTKLNNDDLSNKDLTGTNLVGASLIHTNLDDVDLSGKNLKDVNLSYTNLSGKNLTGTILVGADLTGTNLSAVSLAGKDLTDTKLIKDDLSGKNLTGTILVRADLSYANLNGVDLSGKNLTGTNLSWTDLSNKNFTGTILIGTDLSYTKLNGVDLSGKNLTGTSLVRADLTGVKLPSNYNLK